MVEPEHQTPGHISSSEQPEQEADGRDVQHKGASAITAMLRRTHEQVESDLRPQLPQLLSRALMNYATYRRRTIDGDSLGRMVQSVLDTVGTRTMLELKLENALRFYALTDGQGGRDARNALLHSNGETALPGMITPHVTGLRNLVREFLDPLLQDGTVARSRVEAAAEAGEGLASDLLINEEAYERLTVESIVTRMQRRRTEEWSAALGVERAEEFCRLIRTADPQIQKAFEELCAREGVTEKGLPKRLSTGAPLGMPEYDLPIALLAQASVDDLHALAAKIASSVSGAFEEREGQKSLNLDRLAHALLAYCDVRTKESTYTYRYNLLKIYNTRRTQDAGKYMKEQDYRPKWKWKEQVVPTFRHLEIDRPSIGRDDFERMPSFAESYLDTLGVVPERLYLSHPKLAEVVTLEDISYFHEILKRERDEASTAHDPERKERAQHARAQLLRHFFERGISAKVDRAKEKAKVSVDKIGVRIQIGGTLNAHVPYPYISDAMIAVLEREKWLTKGEILLIRRNRGKALGNAPID